MPIDLKSLQRRGATVTVEYYGESGDVTYDPVKFTSAFREEYGRVSDEMREAAKEAGDNPLPALWRRNATLCAMLVKDWDIVGINGKKLPVDVDAILENLPDPLVQAIIVSVWSDANSLGKRKTSTPSEAGSDQTGS